MQVGCPVNGALDKRSGVLQLQLGLDILPVAGHGFYAQSKLLRDLARTMAFAKKLEYFQFPIAELFQRFTARRGLRIPNRVADDD
jgi:hypothetical protein